MSLLRFLEINLVLNGPISSSSSPPIEIQKPARSKQYDQIAPNKGRQNAQISPPLVEREAIGLIKLIPNLVRAILTRARKVISEIPWPTPFKELRQVVSTILPRRSGEAIELMWPALHHPPVQFRRYHPTHQPRERHELVQPHAPELRYLRLRNRNAAEEGEDDDNEGIEEGGYEGGRGESSDHLAQGDGEELDNKDHQELVARTRRGGLETGNVVEGKEKPDSLGERVSESLGKCRREEI